MPVADSGMDEIEQSENDAETPDMVSKVTLGILTFCPITESI